MRPDGQSAQESNTGTGPELHDDAGLLVPDVLILGFLFEKISDRLQTRLEE